MMEKIFREKYDKINYNVDYAIASPNFTIDDVQNTGYINFNYDGLDDTIMTISSINYLQNIYTIIVYKHNTVVYKSGEVLIIIRNINGQYVSATHDGLNNFIMTLTYYTLPDCDTINNNSNLLNDDETNPQENNEPYIIGLNFETEIKKSNGLMTIIIKLDNNNNLLWTRYIISTSNNFIYSCDTDINNDIYIVGYYNGIIILSSDDIIQDNEQYIPIIPDINNDDDDNIKKLKINSKNSIAIVQQQCKNDSMLESDTKKYESISNDGLIIKISKCGKIIWQTKIGDSNSSVIFGNDKIFKIKIHENIIYLAGIFQASTLVLYCKYETTDIRLYNNKVDNYYGFLATYSLSGIPLYVMKLNRTNPDHGIDMSIRDANNIIIKYTRQKKCMCQKIIQQTDFTGFIYWTLVLSNAALKQKFSNNGTLTSFLHNLYVSDIFSYPFSTLGIELYSHDNLFIQSWTLTNMRRNCNNVAFIIKIANNGYCIWFSKLISRFKTNNNITCNNNIVVSTISTSNSLFEVFGSDNKLINTTYTLSTTSSTFITTFVDYIQKLDIIPYPIYETTIKRIFSNTKNGRNSLIFSTTNNIIDIFDNLIRGIIICDQNSSIIFKWTGINWLILEHNLCEIIYYC